DHPVDLGQRHLIERYLIVKIDGAGHSADQEVGMRVFSADDGLEPYDVPLPVKSLQIMRNRHQVGLRRELVGRVPPVAISEDTQLAAGNGFTDLLLDFAESGGRIVGPGGNGGSQSGGLFRIRLQGACNIHPVQGMKVIEVYDMVLDRAHPDYEAANQLGRMRNRIFEGIFNRPDGGDRMYAGADSADSLGNRPGLPRIVPLENLLDPPELGRTGPCPGDFPPISFEFYPQMPLDTGYRVDYNPFRHNHSFRMPL